MVLIHAGFNDPPLPDAEAYMASARRWATPIRRRAPPATHWQELRPERLLWLGPTNNRHTQAAVRQVAAPSRWCWRCGARAAFTGTTRCRQYCLIWSSGVVSLLTGKPDGGEPEVVHAAAP